MKIIKYLSITALIFSFGFSSSNTVNAATTVPDPVVVYNFESVNGSSVSNTAKNSSIGSATIVGSGSVVADSERGNVFYNTAVDDLGFASVRANYLQLPANAMSKCISGNGYTVSMWIKIDPAKCDSNIYYWSDIFVAYNSSAADKYPMTKLGVNLLGRVNNITYDSGSFFDHQYQTIELFDNKWHQVVFTVSSSYTAVYVDGSLKSSLTLTGDYGLNVGNLLTSAKNNLDVACIGGNSLWNMDPDTYAMFDDITIYNQALTAAQVKETCSGGVSFNGALKVGSNISYTIDSTKINTADIKSYAWYVGTKQVSTDKNYKPTAANAENTITLKITTNSGYVATCSGYLSIFPIIYIDSDTPYSAVNKESSADVTFSISGSGYTDEQLYTGDAEIKLRGNSTAGLEKKPFKVKLGSKVDLLGMGKSKHWVLLADAIDVSLLRNQLLQGLAGDLGLDYMDSKLVTLIYNGEYMGVYELSEHVRIGGTRVDIYDWEELAEDAAKAISKKLVSDSVITEAQRDDVKDELKEELMSNYTWVTSSTHSFVSKYLTDLGKKSSFRISDYIDFTLVPGATGGVLLEMDFWMGDNAELLTAYKQPIYMNTPDTEATFTSLESYMKEYIQAMEYSLHSTDFIFKNSDTHYTVSNIGYYDWASNERVGVTYTKKTFTSSLYNGWHYTDFLDLDSAVNNMIICEFSMNWDCMKNSFFMYKDTDGKIVFGPTWDFDWAWGNSMGQDTNSPDTWQTTNEYFANEQYYQTVQFNRMLIRDPYFLVKLYERYHEVRDKYLAPIVNTTIPALITANQKAGEANVKRWNGAFSATAGQTYSAQTNYVKTFTKAKLAWLDKQFASINTLVNSLGYYKTSTDISTASIDTTSKSGYTVIKVNVTNSSVKKVSFQVNGKNMYTANVNNGVASVSVPDSVLVKTAGKLNVVQYRGMDNSGNYIINSNGTETGNYTNAVSNYDTFTKTIKTETPTTTKKDEVTSENTTTTSSDTPTTEEGPTSSSDDTTSDTGNNESSKNDDSTENSGDSQNTTTHKKDDTTKGSSDNDGNTEKNNNVLQWVLLGIGILASGCIAVCIIIILKNKKKA